MKLTEVQKKIPIRNITQRKHCTDLDGPYVGRSKIKFDSSHTIHPQI